VSKVYEQHEIASKRSLPLTEEELSLMRSSLRESGFDPHYPIYLHESKVLVGWLRYQSCLLEKVQPIFRDYTGKDPVGFVKRSESARKHWNAAQRIKSTSVDWPALEESAKQRKMAGKLSTSQDPDLPAILQEGRDHDGEVNSIIAEQVGVSPRVVYDYRAIQKYGAEALKDAVDNGEISISDGADVARKVAKVDQKKAVTKVKKKKSKTASQAAGLMSKKMEKEIVCCSDDEQKLIRSQWKMGNKKGSKKLLEKFKQQPDYQQRKAEAEARQPGDDSEAESTEEKNKKAEEKAAKAHRDSLGFEIPKPLQDLFGDLFLSESITQLKELIKSCKSYSKQLDYMLLGELITDLEGAKQKLLNSKPYCVHQKCAGKGCDDCRKSGYLTKWKHEELELEGKL
jgi:hypothetical protein